MPVWLALFLLTAMPAAAAQMKVIELSPPSPAETAPATPETTPAPEQPRQAFNAIRLRGLNKVTARISTLEIPLGTVARFGNLEIIAHRCWQAAPEERPESAGLLEIWELKPGEGPERLFSGWMFAENPALSALEHAVYDITVLGCANVALEDE